MHGLQAILVYTAIGILTLVIVIISIILIVGLFTPMSNRDELTTPHAHAKYH